MAPRLTGLVKSFGLAALFLAAALFGTASGVLFAYMGDLPQISSLDDYSPGIITRVLGRDGSVVGDFATERRVLVTYDQIPPVLRNAILSAEDSGFFTHGGLSIPRIVISAVRDLVRMRKDFGASTLTQQLARKLFLTDDKTPERKIKEALLTIQIEKRYTKQEIFTMYCNKMYWGHQTYGVEGASELYFAKHASQLTLDEAALIAGIIQGNDRQSPYRNPSAAMSRRNYTLDRMAANGYITAADAAAAKKRPIVLRGQPTPNRAISPYFVELVRLHLQDRYGAKAVYEDGLTVKTGIDPQLQLSANKALDDGLRRLDKLHGYRKPARNLVAEGQSLDSYKNPRWTRDPAEGDIVPAVVTGADNGVIRLRLGRWQGTIDRTGYEWTHRRAEDIAHRGDLIDVLMKKVDAKSATFSASLEQTPELEGAVVALDNHTGEILAMVGGQNFQRSQFNRATQAMRQVGSLFKPFVYTTAIDRGYTPISVLQDVPTSYDPGPNQPPYSPKNFDKEFQGPVPLRWALEDSRNVPTIALMNALGPQNVIDYARKFGITAPLPPYLPIAIGAGEDTLIEMVSAYTAWPNQGVRMAPLPILEVTDRDGNVLEENRPEPHEAIRADTAYMITALLQGVTRHGTAKHANALDWTIGGKTGTTDEATDAWFIGFDPDITVGVWVGYDQKKSIGATMQGAVAALPIWEDIMKPWIARRRKELPEPPRFERPANIVTVEPGVLAQWVSADVRKYLDNEPEVFISGTEPHN